MKIENDNQDDKTIMPSNLYLVYEKVESIYIFKNLFLILFEKQRE